LLNLSLTFVKRKNVAFEFKKCSNAFGKINKTCATKLLQLTIRCNVCLRAKDLYNYTQLVHRQGNKSNK